MKKVILISLLFLSVMTLTACQKEEVKQEEVLEDTPELVGGWQEAQDQTITQELQDKFDKAMEGYVGMGFTPTKLLATQVVSGTNYKFLCDAVSVTAEPVKSQKIVTIYEDLQGNIKITDVEDIEE